LASLGHLLSCTCQSPSTSKLLLQSPLKHALSP
jgi:hypothetical protein